MGTAPKGAWIDAIGIEFQHLVVEFARSLRRLVQTDKVADVSPRLFDVLGIVIVLRHLMPGNDRARVQRLDLVKRSDPLNPGLLIRLDKVWMNAIVNRVTGHDQID